MTTTSSTIKTASTTITTTTTNNNNNNNKIRRPGDMQGVSESEIGTEGVNKSENETVR